MAIEMLLTLSQGATLVLYEMEERWHHTLFQAIARQRISITSLAPGLPFARYRAELAGLRCVLAIGEMHPFPQWFQSQLQHRLAYILPQLYWPCQIDPQMLYRVALLEDGGLDIPERPCFAAADMVGRLHYSWNGEGIDAGLFVRKQADGRLVYLGRESVTWRGKRVWLEDLAALVRQISEISEVFVALTGAQQIVIYLRASPTRSSEEVRRQLFQALHPLVRIHEVIFLSHWPLQADGSLAVQDLPIPEGSGQHNLSLARQTLLKHRLRQLTGRSETQAHVNEGDGNVQSI
jgi:hypothetical protein